MAAYGLDGPARPITSGLINTSFAVSTSDDPARPVAVVQRLHPIFGPEVNLDLEAVSAHLKAAGLDSPGLLRTRDGARWVEQPSGVWRAIDYLDGLTLHRVEAPETARAAGALVGRFHRALDSLVHEYAFTRAGVHDTDAHLDRLAQRARAPSARGDELERDAQALASDILAAAEALPALPALPLRHTHGDLKISNVLFFPKTPDRARCLIDLDTLGRQTLAYELGDALRSWCNPSGEDVREVNLNEALFAAAMDGYRDGAGDLLLPAERAAIVPGIETVCIELAARFCVDVFDDSYFGWDPGRFGSRREHNLVRARGQLALAVSVRARRRALAAQV